MPEWYYRNLLGRMSSEVTSTSSEGLKHACTDSNAIKLMPPQ
jgi:hypothetical protein